MQNYVEFPDSLENIPTKGFISVFFWKDTSNYNTINVNAGDSGLLSETVYIDVYDENFRSVSIVKNPLPIKINITISNEVLGTA